MINVVILSEQPVAGAAWLIYSNLKKYVSDSLNVRFVSSRAHYNDGRTFPKDLLLTDPVSKDIIRAADIVHIHNTLWEPFEYYIDKGRQHIYGTLHSIPRQQRWKELIAYCHETFSIRFPAQMVEYAPMRSLATPYDIWEWAPKPREWQTLNIVYCPTSIKPEPHPQSKGYEYVMPVLDRIARSYPSTKIIHFTNKPYIENIKAKRDGHIVIDDVCHKTFHSTTIEAASNASCVLTGVGKDEGYPFLKTHYSYLEGKLRQLIEYPLAAQEIGKNCRTWMEQYWEPKSQCQEYINLYSKS